MRLPPHIALTAAAAVIGLSSIAVKFAYEEGAEPGDLLAARFGLAALAFAVILPLLIRRRPVRRPGVVTGWAAAAGVGLFFGTWLEFAALDRLPAAVVIVILCSAPVWAALLRWAIWREPTTRTQIAAALIVIAGVALIADPAGGELDRVGCLMALVNAVIAGAFFLLIERVSPDVSARVFVPAAMCGAGLIALVTQAGSFVDGLTSAGLAHWLLLLGAAGVLYGLLAGAGMEGTDSVSGGIVLASEPVFVAVAAFLILDEGLSLLAIAGGAVTMLGVVLSVRANPGPASPPI